jgi:hypothetical protein
MMVGCALLVLACAGCPASQAVEGAEELRAERGLEISPVAVDASGKDERLVAIGSYIVNAQGACNDCHTNPIYEPGNDPFQGQVGAIDKSRFLAGGRVFGPNLVSPNITPDSAGNPAGLTLEEFINVLRTGRDPKDNHILQMMPWPVYRYMTDRDLRAIYEYLRSIPHAEPGP